MPYTLPFSWGARTYVMRSSNVTPDSCAANALAGDATAAAPTARRAAAAVPRLGVIIVDPGIGFGKAAGHNREVIDRLDELKVLGLPILLGPSRKRFIGRILGDAPPEQRLEGTVAAVAIGITRGADIVRVHDVEAMVKA